jgi:hypothetical protein
MNHGYRGKSFGHLKKENLNLKSCWDILDQNDYRDVYRVEGEEKTAQRFLLSPLRCSL